MEASALLQPPLSSPIASGSVKYNFLIASAVIASIFVASAFVYLLVRLLSSCRLAMSIAAAPRLHHGQSESSSSSFAAYAGEDSAALVDSLPLFSLASLAVIPSYSPDCAVCLCPFLPHDELRLLPACRHAFHSQCVDPWLRSTPFCPLCRASIAIPAPPLTQPGATTADPSTIGSYRVEIGIVSQRRAMSEPISSRNPLSHLQTFSLGSSFEYIVNDEEAVLARIGTENRKEEKSEESYRQDPGAEAAEVAGGGGRGWLRDHLDRLASSASSTFSSIHFSGRWSHRYDGGG
ncbi:hypothetical protein ZIOFF_064868 [Zingiber officinale]|uniref:RING-type domain-containing protein n=1 Tax=Zingiber officinale TaxID=94328 RepID=A0A8J5EWJ1_ZINOF|nr:hypothetical protein ZIOFF_064868 [Zingiber officinale]